MWGKLMTRPLEGTSTLLFIRHSRAAVWRHRLAHWLLGDYRREDQGSDDNRATVFKRITETLRSCLRSTRRAMREDWRSAKPEDFTGLR